MSNINNQTQDLYSIELVQDLDHEAAATVTGGLGYFNSNDPDVIVYKDANLQGLPLNINAAVNDGIPNIGTTDGNGGGFSTGFNDVVSSIRILRGTWNFFQDINYGGDSTGILYPGNYNLGYNNDKISSLYRIA